MTETPDQPLIPAEWLERAVNPSLPPGVLACQDSTGRWWRYPLAEFPDFPEPGIRLIADTE